jgi:hypothetical protein
LAWIFLSQYFIRLIKVKITINFRKGIYISGN